MRLNGLCTTLAFAPKVLEQGFGSGKLHVVE